MNTVPIELRVVAGPQTGAGLALVPGATIDIGSLAATGCQVVLRGREMADQRLRLHIGARAVRVEVLVGRIDLAGRPLAAPCTVEWPPFLPITIGDTVLAIGEPGDPRWDDVLAVAEAAPLAGIPFAGEAAQATTESGTAAPLDPDRADGDPHRLPAPPAASSATRHRLEKWLAVVGALVAVAAIGTLALRSVIESSRRPSPTAQERLQSALDAPGFAGLRVEARRDQPLAVRGALVSAADRARLERVLSESRVPALLDVSVGEHIAVAVRDVYRMNGVAADVAMPTTLDEIGAVRVRTASADLPRLVRLEANVRQDVHGLRQLTVDNAPPAPVPDATALPDEPGKRVASIVPGESPYVVTADGTRYFLGALLPSGHRLAAIRESQVMLEKDGKQSPLDF